MSPLRATQQTADAIVQNTAITALSRLAVLALPLVGGAFLYLLQEKVAAVETAISGQNTDVHALQQRVIAVETRAEASRDERDRFYAQTDDRLKSIEAAIGGLSQSVSGLNATLQAQEERSRR